MKRYFFITVLLFTINFSVQAQETRINLYAGYVFDDNIDEFNDYNQYVNATVNGGFQPGGSIEFVTPGEVGIELMYIGQTTKMPLTFNSGFLTGPRSGTFDLNLNYVLAGLNKYARADKMEGYFGLMMGCLFSNANNAGNTDSVGTSYGSISTSNTRFSWGLKLGANYWIMKSVGIKLQAQFLSTLEAYGGTSYYGYYGNYYGYYSYLNLFQWNFSTGLVFKF